MEYLSKRKLKAFAQRFGYQKKDQSGEIKKISLTLEEAKQAVGHFISLRRDPELKPSFVETRVKVLEICLEEKSPLERWNKVKDFLIDRLESQVLNVYITQGILQDHEVEPWGVLSYLMKPDSFLSWCIKVVVLFNITDDNPNLPDDLVYDVGSGLQYSFPEHQLKRNGILLKASTREGGFIEKLIPFNRENYALAFGHDLQNKFSVTYSILLDQDSRSYVIRHDEFYDEFSKQHPDLIRTYKLNSNLTPVEILEKTLNKAAQKKILTKFVKNPITEWRWEKKVFTSLDLTKLVKEYFPGVKEEIVSIKPIISPRWKPNNYLFDEDLLRYELTDLYLQRLDPYQRENLLIEHIRDFSIFNLKTFRDTIAKWEYDKENGRIVWMLETLKSQYHKHKRVPKERDKWLEYVRISYLIQKYKKPMLAYRMYRMTVRHSDKVETIKVEYLRQKEKAIQEGYDVKNPKHLEEIKKKWNLVEAWDLVY